MNLLKASGSVVFGSRDTTPGAGAAQWATDGSPVGPVPATQFPAYHYNLVMGELYNIVLQGGLTPSDTDFTQILQAILAFRWQADVGLVNALAITPPVALPAAASITDGTEIIVKPAYTNTSSIVTLAVSGGIAQPVKFPDGSLPAVGTIVAGMPIRLLKTGGGSPVWWLLGNAAVLPTPAVSVDGFRNSTCIVAKRGTSGTVSSGTSAYTLDGHYLTATGAGLAWAKVAGIGFAPFALQLTCALGLTGAKWAQPIESSRAARFAGRMVTVQATIVNSAPGAITPKLTVKHLNASDVGVTAPWTGGAPAASTIDVTAQNLQACPASGAQTTVAWSFVAHASFGNGAYVELDFGNGLNGAGTITLADVNLTATPYAAAGLNASPPIPVLAKREYEELECQRFLPGFQGLGVVGPGGGFSSGSPPTTAYVNAVFVPFARIAPSSLVVSSPSHFSASAGGQSSAPGGIMFGNAGPTGAHIVLTGLSYGTSPVQGWSADLIAGNAAASIIFPGAEL